MPQRNTRLQNSSVALLSLTSDQVLWSKSAKALLTQQNTKPHSTRLSNAVQNTRLQNPSVALQSPTSQLFYVVEKHENSAYLTKYKTTLNSSNAVKATGLQNSSVALQSLTSQLGSVVEKHESSPYFTTEHFLPVSLIDLIFHITKRETFECRIQKILYLTFFLVFN